MYWIGFIVGYLRFASFRKGFENAQWRYDQTHRQQAYYQFKLSHGLVGK